MNPLPAKDAASRAYNAFNSASFTIGTKSGNVINVAVQLKEARGQAPALGVCQATIYLSDNADGSTLTASAAGTLAIGTHGVILLAEVAGKMHKLITDSAGRFDINITQASSPTIYYLVVVLPDGSLNVSTAITF